MSDTNPAPTPRTDAEEISLEELVRKYTNTATPTQVIVSGMKLVRSDFARTLERELTSAQAALAAKDAEIKRLQEFELDVTCIGRDVHDYCQDLKADRTRRLPTLVLTMIGNLRARAEKAEAELADVKDTLAIETATEKCDSCGRHIQTTLVESGECIYCILKGIKAERDQLRAELAAARKHANDEFDTIITRNTELEKQLAAAKEDTERLDWLDEHTATLNAQYGTEYGWKFSFNHNRTQLELSDCNIPALTIRQAIDQSARRAQA